MTTPQARNIVIVSYDAEWPNVFDRLKFRITPALHGIAVAIEHVGSTSVPGLAAKPVIDMDVVVARERDVPLAIAALAGMGYAHRGDLGISGREAFASPPETTRHHLYVVVINTKSYWDHVRLRDYLRLNPDARLTYELVKRGAAERFPHDIDAYMAAKKPFIEGILALANNPDLIGLHSAG